MATERKESLNSSQLMKDSWVSVEEPGLTHVKSSEEMTELLAEAVNEPERGKVIKLITTEQEQQHIEIIGKSVIYQEDPYELASESIESQNSTALYSVKSFLWTLVSPPFILSHITVFLIGILVGRRLMAV